MSWSTQQAQGGYTQAQAAAYYGQQAQPASSYQYQTQPATGATASSYYAQQPAATTATQPTAQTQQAYSSYPYQYGTGTTAASGTTATQQAYSGYGQTPTAAATGTAASSYYGSATTANSTASAYGTQQYGQYQQQTQAQPTQQTASYGQAATTQQTQQQQQQANAQAWADYYKQQQQQQQQSYNYGQQAQSQTQQATSGATAATAAAGATAGYYQQYQQPQQTQQQQQQPQQQNRAAQSYAYGHQQQGGAGYGQQAASRQQQSYQQQPTHQSQGGQPHHQQATGYGTAAARGGPTVRGATPTNAPRPAPPKGGAKYDPYANLPSAVTAANNAAAAVAARGPTAPQGWSAQDRVQVGGGGSRAPPAVGAPGGPPRPQPYSYQQRPRAGYGQGPSAPRGTAGGPNPYHAGPAIAVGGPRPPMGYGGGSPASGGAYPQPYQQYPRQEPKWESKLANSPKYNFSLVERSLSDVLGAAPRDSIMFGGLETFFAKFAEQDSNGEFSLRVENCVDMSICLKTTAAITGAEDRVVEKDAAADMLRLVNPVVNPEPLTAEEFELMKQDYNDEKDTLRSPELPMKYSVRVFALNGRVCENRLAVTHRLNLVVVKTKDNKLRTVGHDVDEAKDGNPKNGENTAAFEKAARRAILDQLGINVENCEFIRFCETVTNHGTHRRHTVYMIPKLWTLPEATLPLQTPRTVYEEEYEQEEEQTETKDFTEEDKVEFKAAWERILKQKREHVENDPHYKNEKEVAKLERLAAFAELEAEETDKGPSYPATKIERKKVMVTKKKKVIVSEPFFIQLHHLSQHSFFSGPDPVLDTESAGEVRLFTISYEEVLKRDYGRQIVNWLKNNKAERDEKKQKAAEDKESDEPATKKQKTATGESTEGESTSEEKKPVKKTRRVAQTDEEKIVPFAWFDAKRDSHPVGTIAKEIMEFLCFVCGGCTRAEAKALTDVLIYNTYQHWNYRAEFTKYVEVEIEEPPQEEKKTEEGEPKGEEKAAEGKEKEGGEKKEAEAGKTAEPMQE